MATTDRLTIRGLLAEAESSLATGAHPDRARRDVEALLLQAMKEALPEVNHAWLIAHDNESLPSVVRAGFLASVGRRRAGEPVQYIAGEAEFYGLKFSVNRDVLIPRPETEHLVEKAIELARRFEQPRIVDVGTGSGAIAVALASQLAAARIAATELSAAALRVARANAERNGVTARVQFREGDLLAPVREERFDLIISNPPYVADSDRSSLPVEVRDYEPAQALFAGADGLEVYRRLIPAAFEALDRDGFLVLELGFGQDAAVGALLTSAGFTETEFAMDLQGIVRVAVARRP